MFLLRFLGSPSITVKGSKRGREHKMLLGCCHPPSISLSLLLLCNSLSLSLSRRVSIHSPSFDYTSNTLKDMKLLHSYGAECKPSPSAFTDTHKLTFVSTFSSDVHSSFSLPVYSLHTHSFRYSFTRVTKRRNESGKSLHQLPSNSERGGRN